MSEKVIQTFDHITTEPNGNFDRSWRDEKWDGDRKLSVVARDAAFNEKDMTIRQALKIYRKAVIWCLIISMCVIMEGFDTNVSISRVSIIHRPLTIAQLLGNFFAYPSFQLKYGDPVPVTEQTPYGRSLSAAWQTGLNQGSSMGSIFGTILNGWLITAFGPRKVLLCTLVVMTCFVFIVFFAPNKPVLLVGEILLGFEWGIVSLPLSSIVG